jgi:hypothetical protein
LTPYDEHGCADDNNDNRSSSIIPSKVKANLVRLPRVACPRCGRKRVYPEKMNGSSSSSYSRYRSAKECGNCIMVARGLYKEIRKYKPKNGKELLFPLNVLNITNNIWIGEFCYKQKIQEVINKYQQQREWRVDISVIYFPKYYDFTSYFSNTSSSTSTSSGDKIEST